MLRRVQTGQVSAVLGVMLVDISPANFALMEAVYCVLVLLLVGVQLSHSLVAVRAAPVTMLVHFQMSHRL